MSVTWAPSHMHTTSCPKGYGMCVSLKHGLVVVSVYYEKLHVYSLDDGSLVRVIGGQNAQGKGKFDFGIGGLCMSPDGDSVLLANLDRVQEVNITDGSSGRSIGKGVLTRPQFVDCNNQVIVVSGDFRLSVLSWRTGDLVSQFGIAGRGPGQLVIPHGVRLLSNGTQLAVADATNHRLCVLSLSGEFVQALGSEEQGLNDPFDMLECDNGFIVSNWGASDTLTLVRVSLAGEVMGVYGNGEFNQPSTSLAALPDGGLVVRGGDDDKFRVFRGLGLRVAWITVCVLLARK